MSWLTLAAIYFVLWWIVLFAVLPWGVKGQHEGGAFEPGTEPGAPQRAMMARKFLATTLIAAVGLAVAYFAWEWGLIPFDRIPMPY